MPNANGHSSRLTLTYSRPTITFMDYARFEQDADRELKGLEQRIDELVKNCERLKEENRLLRSQQEAYSAERATLIEKNELARARVEAMINRLRSMENTA